MNNAESLLTSIQASLDAINARLDSLEAGIPAPVAGLSPDHPSLNKFSIAEAVADQIIAGMKTEKTCTFEPNGRPCDHCSMCSSRGF